MLPTINSYGDSVIISKYYRRGRDLKVGDAVSFAHPVVAGMQSLKRVVGMAGDFVERDTPGSDSGMMVQVPKGHCWVVGDNLSYSRDSRHFGPLPLALIKGKAIVRFVGGAFWNPVWLDNNLVPATLEYDDDDESLDDD